MTTRAEIEANGMWLGSGLGVSFVCRCGWNSGIMPEPADVRSALDHHVDVVHGDGIRGVPCKHKDHWNCGAGGIVSETAQHWGTKCIGACCDNYTGDWEVSFVATPDGPMCMRCWHQKRGPSGRIGAEDE